MAITLVGTATGHILSSTENLEITLPSMQEGDLVLVITGGQASYWTPEVLTAGYTEIVNLGTASPSYANLVVAWKFMGATPDTTVECDNAGATDKDAMGIAYVLRGVDQTTPIDVTPTEDYSLSTYIIDIPSITPVTSGALIVACGDVTIAGSAGPDPSVDPPTGYSNQVLMTSDAAASYDSNMIVASKLWGGVGEEDPGTWDIDGDTMIGSAAIATSIAVRPAEEVLSNATLTITGQVSTVTVPVHFSVSGNLTNLKGSGSIADSFDLLGNLPELQGSLDWGVEVAIDAALPAIDGSMDLGFSAEGDLPTLNGAVDMAVPFEISGDLPYLTGSMDCGFIASGGLPELRGSMIIDQENSFDIDVDLPGLMGSMELSVSFSISASLPQLSGSMSLESYDYFNISGSLPQLNGSFSFEDADSFIVSGKLPALTGSAEMEIEQTMVIDADLPPLDLSLFDFSDIASVDLSGSFTPTSDDIIRHRRGYDNG